MEIEWPVDALDDVPIQKPKRGTRKVFFILSGSHLSSHRVTEVRVRKRMALQRELVRRITKKIEKVIPVAMMDRSNLLSLMKSISKSARSR